MWKMVKPWIIEALISILFLFCIPAILFVTRTISIKVNPSIILPIIGYIIIVFSSFIEKYMSMGLCAFFDLLFHNVKSNLFLVTNCDEKSFLWDRKYSSDSIKIISKKFFIISCYDIEKSRKRKLFSTVPIWDNNIYSVSFLKLSGIIVTIKPVKDC